MVLNTAAVFQNRKHAAYLLGERLMEYNNTEAIVMAVSGGGIHIGSYLAQLLHLNLEVIPCKKIKHPADSHKTIGAVSTDAVVVHEEGDIPQDYIYHQIQLLRHIIQGQNKNFYRGHVQASLKNETIILVDDLLKTGDTMLATLKTIRKQQPKKIIVAVPNVTPEGTRAIADEIDEIIYLTIEQNIQAVGNLYENFPAVHEREVIAILQQAWIADSVAENV
jgi:putative phosphoribosyl transferase